MQNGNGPAGDERFQAVVATFRTQVFREYGEGRGWGATIKGFSGPVVEFTGGRLLSAAWHEC